MGSEEQFRTRALNIGGIETENHKLPSDVMSTGQSVIYSEKIRWGRPRCILGRDSPAENLTVRPALAYTDVTKSGTFHSSYSFTRLTAAIF